MRFEDTRDADDMNSQSLCGGESLLSLPKEFPGQETFKAAAVKTAAVSITGKCSNTVRL